VRAPADDGGVRRVRSVPSTLLLAALTCAAACPTQRPPELWSTPKFPERLQQVVLPMRDPLEQPDLAVVATLEGHGGKRRTIWMRVDTGATHSTIPAGLLRELGLTELGTTKIRGVHGLLIVPVASLPRLFLGAMAVERVPVLGLTFPSELREHGVLGQSVLDQAPWEISWDRATITWNATPWTDGGDVTAWPLVRGDHGFDFIDARINGVAIRMELDTGGTVSAIPKNLAAAIGLVPHPAPNFVSRTIHGERAIGPVFVADLEIGSSNLPRQFFSEDPPGAFGRVGLASLVSYEVQIFPGSRLLIRPRNPDMRATAAMRIRRWPWMPSCRSAGCFRGYLEGSGEGGRIIFEPEATLPHPVAILFGCAEVSDPDWVRPHVLRGEPEPPFRHVRLELMPGDYRAISLSLPDVEKVLVLPSGQRCRELTALDVFPLRDLAQLPEKVRLSLLP
jgi:aspartyl protease